MDSWTLQGDRYSFKRSVPRTFSLCHREGTPNHVEIFDIINIPAQRTVISETTCLCDIFGVDGESVSLSSSPSAVPFVPSQTEVNDCAAASPSVDDVNDSSGSYHTAPGSSEGEEGFDDSRERYYSPVWQKESIDGRQSDEKGLNSEHSQVSEDSISNSEPKINPVLLQNTNTPSSITPSSQSLNSGQTTPSPRSISPCIFNPEGRLSSSSSSAEKGLLPLTPGTQGAQTETEPSTITPPFKDRHRASIQALSSSLPQDLHEPIGSQSHQNNSSTCETHIQLSQDYTDLKSTTIYSSSQREDSKSPTERQFIFPEHRNTSPRTQVSSPFSELGGRVSVPDLFSRGSTPDRNDSGNTTELISDLSTAERDTTSITESQDTGLSTGQGSSLSTPGPEYTPPSSVISTASSPELLEAAVSAGINSTGTSPQLLSPTFPVSLSRTPPLAASPVKENNLECSESRSQVSSPVVINSLSPLSRVHQNNAPLEDRYTTPSPEIRIISSSPEPVREEQQSQENQSLELQQSSSPLEERYSLPSPEAGVVSPSLELFWNEQTSQVKSASKSPLSEPHVCPPSPRSFTYPAQITGVSYSVIQPEDRTSPPFPELSHISSPNPNEFQSPESGIDSSDTSAAESTRSQRNSPHIDIQSSGSLSQPRSQTPSPQPVYLPSLPEHRFETCSPEFQSLSSQLHNPSHETQFLGLRYQQSPEVPSTDLNPLYTKPVPIDSETECPSGFNTVGCTGIPSPTGLAREAVSPLFNLERREETSVAEFSKDLSVVEVCTPISFLSDKNSYNYQKQHITEIETKQEEFCGERSGVVLLTREKLSSQTPFSEEEITSPCETKSNRATHKAVSREPVQKQDNLHLLIASHSPNFDSDFCPQSWTYTPQNSRRKLLPKVIQEDRERLAGDMSRHVNRRQTPSPPLTRFTPVHIIAPQKPYRKWQNRSNSPSQVLESPLSGNLAEAATNRESPNVDPVDNNSQAQWVRPGKQLEIDSDMPLEQEREEVMEGQMDRGMNREGKREEQPPDREGWQGVTSYRGEQVELSFNPRNRKGPVSHSAAPTTRDTRQGLPTAHSYSESLPATRQSQQQQSRFKLSPKPDPSGCSSIRRLKPPTSQDRRSAPRRVATNRQCPSSSSSMGSELDEADNEVKWLTDAAFRSLSSPEVDYLEMYNSSHCSSANISQPSTLDSPAGLNAAWLSYADFKGSAPKLDLDELSSHQQYSHNFDCLDPSKRYELGSFECIDVAVEREDSRKVRRGVPKRQIQLKRRNNTEGKQDESSETSSPGLPAMVESPSQEIHPRGIFVRQHSTPAAIQKTPTSDSSSEIPRQKGRQFKLQKSASMDETCSKTKIASCHIKNVLSKKMQVVDRQPDQQIRGEGSPPTESGMAPSEESLKLDSSNMSSSLQSDHNLSSEGLLLREESGMKNQDTVPKDHGVKCSYRPSSSSSCRSVTFPQLDCEEGEEEDSQTRSTKSTPSEVKSKINTQFESDSADLQCWKTHERVACESVKASAWDTGASSANVANNMQARVTNKDQEQENKKQHRQMLQEETDDYTSKMQEMALKPVEKKKASLKVCLTPEAESKPFPPDTSAGEMEKAETKVEGKIQVEGHDEDGFKAPIHKVRDVRRLVKNTYNLSFKAVSPVNPSNVIEESCYEKKMEEVSATKGGNVLQEVSREEKREEGEEELRILRTQGHKEEAKDSETPVLPDSAQNKINSQLCLQPMQIECKAVCWKDDKNKMSSIKKNFDDKPKNSSASPPDANLISNTLKHTREDKMVEELDRCDISLSASKKETVTDIVKLPSSEDKPALVRTDQKPPMLGNIPKVPSKEREVSTAVVLIREKSNKPNLSASLTHEETSTLLKAPASLSPGPSASGEVVGGSGGHSVSMLLKEKGYQADIGAVMGDSQNSSKVKEVPCKHVNSLEIPLQTIHPSERGFPESHRERTFSSSSTASGPSGTTQSVEVFKKPVEEEELSIKPPKNVTERTKTETKEHTTVPTKQKDTIVDFEAVKRLDPTFPPRSPAIRRFKPQPSDTRSPLKEIEKKEISNSSKGNHRPQTIEVKSIAKHVQVVPPKPNCKSKPENSGNGANEAHRTSSASSAGKQRNEERPQTIVVSSPTVYRKISNEAVSSSNYSRKLAVSAVSSLKPPPHRTAAPVSSVSNASTSFSGTEAATDRGQHQPSAAPPQSTRHAQKLASPATSDTVLGVAPQLVPEPNPNQNTGSILSEAEQSTSGDPDSQLQYSGETCAHEQTRPVTSSTVKQVPSITSTQRYTHHPYSRVPPSDVQRIDDHNFYASDDPPSYDERESFSPLLLPDLTSVRSNQYQPSSLPAPCSCGASYSSHCGPTSPNHHCSPHDLTPPCLSHSPGSTFPYQMAQPPLPPHHCRPEHQPIGYQPRSPKSSPLGPNPPPSMYQSIHHSANCASHPSLVQSCPADRSLPLQQHIGARRPPVRRSPHQQPAGLTGVPYSDPGHSHSPGLPPMDPQYLCGPQNMGPSYGSEYGGDSSSVYSEGSFAQPPRRVLLDPETGKYFYIEVPVQPLRKMLFDPETGQYVEVLIPQQAISHSGLYPPTAAPFPPLHNPNIYAQAPQYIPCAAPPLAHPQAQPQPPQYPDASAAPTVHPSGPGVNYRNPSGQGSKQEHKKHPPLDQRYPENMYYVQSVINASPNTTPPEYYHRHPSSLPPPGGKRS
ncbi:uncharacterized protein si:ch73-43g23.1 [Cyprinodon tularosa]|uniref:uncharacterized protein si:ch73-43g23.1 n=1 Tax=Cyprinodon tularosa TaxID=77115 RepID=UPI0018E23AF0|nr:uncharacterized protein si:ch73-43g23.1 [Cyprinodon tularosa]